MSISVGFTVFCMTIMCAEGKYVLAAWGVADQELLEDTVTASATFGWIFQLACLPYWFQGVKKAVPYKTPQSSTNSS